ncbi:MAG: hypothetical protein COS84_11860 [Armatimonadetes bacterium CG07_land_8_20_14_0_80_40_9]|nr:MAG: hypothetical protein COS84_11860 [Armatimonadetes bacterium CG07_land_8_20_14_0_80_40_9]
MKTTLLVDGYNVIWADLELNRLMRSDPKKARQRLIDQLSRYREDTLHQIIVVFDGARGGGLEQNSEEVQGVEIIYSRRGEEADSVIKELVLKSDSPSSIVVASSDREIKNYAVTKGASTVGAGRLWQKVKERLEEKVGFDWEREVKGYIPEEEEERPRRGSPYQMKKKRRREQGIKKLW